jgi:hypothetical protein
MSHSAPQAGSLPTPKILQFFCAFQFQQNNTKDGKKIELHKYLPILLFLCNMHKVQFGYLQRLILDLLLEAELAKLRKAIQVFCISKFNYFT